MFVLNISALFLAGFSHFSFLPILWIFASVAPKVGTTIPVATWASLTRKAILVMVGVGVHLVGSWFFALVLCFSPGQSQFLCFSVPEISDDVSP